MPDAFQLPPPPAFEQTLGPLFTGIATGLNNIAATALKAPADLLATITQGATQASEQARTGVQNFLAAPLAAMQAGTAARAQAPGAGAQQYQPPAPTYTPPGAQPTAQPREFTI